MSIPRSALMLGWAGVIPFAALTGALWFRLSVPVEASSALRAYGALILSFMGGVQWGVTLLAADGSEQGWRGYGFSVLPALVGWAALMASGAPALLVLAAAFVALLSYDLWTVRLGYAPRWYGALRIQLTAAVVVLLMAAAGVS